MPLVSSLQKKSMHINYEFKAVCPDLDAAESRLLQNHPDFKGTDHQTDTYFHVHAGRLKLREGNIENALIHYERMDQAAAKLSHVLLYQHQPDSSLKQILTRSMGIKVVVNKQRKIYFIDNVKFHFDIVQGLGTFIEVEAIDTDGSIGLESLKAQCTRYIDMLGITKDQFIAESYSDLLEKKSSTA